MFQNFVKNYDLKDLNSFQGAMRQLRKNKKNKKDKIFALNKQIKYFDLMTKSSDEWSTRPYQKYTFAPKHLDSLSTSQVNKLWYTFKPKHMKSKKAHQNYLNGFANQLQYLNFYNLYNPAAPAAAPAPALARAAAAVAPVQPTIARGVSPVRGRPLNNNVFQFNQDLGAIVRPNR